MFYLKSETIMISSTVILLSFDRRGKLFNYGESLLNKGTGTKTWNERGIGEIKILKYVIYIFLPRALIPILDTKKLLIFEY